MICYNNIIEQFVEEVQMPHNADVLNFKGCRGFAQGCLKSTFIYSLGYNKIQRRNDRV